MCPIMDYIKAKIIQNDIFLCKLKILQKQGKLNDKKEKYIC